MEKKRYAPIYDKLLPIYRDVATPTWRGNGNDTKIAVGTGPSEGRWERNAVGLEGVLVLDEYRRNGRNFEPRFSYDLEEHGIRCDHSDTSFIMVLSSARNKFAEVTGMTFRDWLEANGERVDHLYESDTREKRVAYAYRDDTPEEIAEREERSRKLGEEDRSGWEDQSMFSDEETPEHKATRKSRKAREEELKTLFAETKANAEAPKPAQGKAAKTKAKAPKPSAAEEARPASAEQLGFDWI